VGSPCSNALSPDGTVEVLLSASDNVSRKFQYTPLSISAVDPISQLSWIGKSLLFAQLSRLAYGEPDEVSELAYAAGIDECEFIADEGAEVYVFGSRHDCMVVPRGTEPTQWDDISADANAWTIAIEVGRVHSGFHKHVDVLWPKIEILLRENQRPVWFAGHSLGGAMAILCALRCRLSQIPSEPQAILTYGSPRVGDRKLVNFLKIRHYRWVNNNDIVPRVPPRWMGYRHMGRELYLNRRGKISSLPLWLRLQDAWRGFVISLSQWKIDPFTDHSMVEYIRHIEKYHEAERQGKKIRMPRFRHAD
jgi:triacylglycerol lipase